MIEQLIYNFLTVRAPFPVYMEVPEGGGTPPFAVIEKTGGGVIDNHVWAATLAIQSYGGTLLEAAQTNELVKGLMAEAIELPDVARCRLNSDYNFTDTTKKLYRYQAVFDIIHY